MRAVDLPDSSDIVHGAQAAEAPADAQAPVCFFDDRDWGDSVGSTDAEAPLEDGQVLCFPHLPFDLNEQERRLLDTRFADPKAKNINLREGDLTLRGACGSADELALLQAMVLRFRRQAVSLTARLFPHYRGHLKVANTSYRPVAVEGRPSSWRKDDSRLHIDAFPSNPMHGLRLLRVFSNINPHGLARSWRVGEPFEAFARRQLPGIAPERPGSAWLLHRLHITKRPRSAYDHLMLQLHDRAKADAEWQRGSAQHALDFAPGTTWVVFSDQVLHAAMGGQFMMEQTFTLDPDDQLDPAKAPLRVLERLCGRALRP
jgi:hypothetical protein